MKLNILTWVAILFSLNGYAQTKGNNALGLGVFIDNQTREGSYVSTYESKLRSYSLGYGVFTGVHDKIGMELTYGTQNSESKSLSDSGSSKQDEKSYGGSLTYQHFYPLLKTLYAYAGGKAGYTYSESRTLYPDAGSNVGDNSINKFYTAGANGGITWFLSKSFAFEVNIFTLNATYNTTVQETLDGDVSLKSEGNGFTMNTQGVINNLGFKIFLLF